MKKILLAFIGLLTLNCISCSPNETKQKLTYGSFIEQKEESYGKGGYKIFYSDLVRRIENDEVMLLAVYPGDSSSCGCWLTFRNHIQKFVNDYNYKIYVANYAEFPALNTDPYGFIHADDRPTFHIIANKKVIYKVDYKDNRNLFQDSSLLKKMVDEYVLAPSIYEVDEPSLNTIISTQESVNIFYAKSTCGDCNYVIPNVLIPYFNSSPTEEKLYMFDLNPIAELENDRYQTVKDFYGLSSLNDPIFGYGVGYVPTFQHRENGIIKSNAVYFNDSINKNELGEYNISKSYYSQDRVNNLEYLNNYTNTKVLEGLKLSPTDIYEAGEYIGWQQEKAAKYHDPLLKAFLDYYF